MKTKWDYLFALFELKETKLMGIAKKTNSNSSSVRQRLVELLKYKIIVQEKGLYKPNKDNSITWTIFNIMKFCKNRGINYNLFLNKEFAEIVRIGLSKEEVILSYFKSLNTRTVRKYLTYLSRINLLFVVSKRPLKVKFVFDPVFDEVLTLFKLKKDARKSVGNPILSDDYKEIEKQLVRLKELKKNLSFTDIDEERKIEFTSASTQLEGNTFTLEESKELILHDVVPQDKKLKEANEVKNYYAAVNYLFNHSDQLISIDYILDLHRIVIFNLGVKEGVRTTSVSIKGNPFYKVSYFSEIYSKLDDMCKKINEFMTKKKTAKEVVEFATFVHNEFQHIHPFEDGNSRTTRLLWNYILMKNEFPLINIYSNTRQEYLSLTKLARERNDAKLNSFLVKIIKDNLYKLTRF
ncbi:MAG: Fic family protein [Candidatus Micrarchaeota archaeon]|nr:Fic family protein [Candidatus Micrarchaeota archaeon]